MLGNIDKLPPKKFSRFESEAYERIERVKKAVKTIKNYVELANAYNPKGK